jgi:hypothetical protein
MITLEIYGDSELGSGNGSDTIVKSGTGTVKGVMEGGPDFDTHTFDVNAPSGFDLQLSNALPAPQTFVPDEEISESFAIINHPR